jgi:class 3 adenylate cyclase
VGTLRGLTERRAILDRLIREYRGRIANTAGDSVLAEFGRRRTPCSALWRRNAYREPFRSFGSLAENT